MKKQKRAKFSLLLASLSCTSSQVLAQYSYYDGMIMGVGLGASAFMSKIHTQTSIGNTNDYSTNHIYQYGPMGTFFLGHNWFSNNGFYFGAELGLNLFSAHELTQSDVSQFSSTFSIVEFGDSFTNNDALTTQYKVTRHPLEPYFDIKMGFLFSPDALLYARGGINYNEIKIYTNDYYQALGFDLSGLTFLLENSTLNVKREQKKLGIRVGTGLEYLFNPAVGLGFSYNFTFYSHLKDNPSTTGSEVSCDLFEGCVALETSFTDDIQAKNYDQQAMLELIYHFGG